MTRAHTKPGLRPYLREDAPLCAAIFCASISELTNEDYNPAQQDAWMAAADDEDAFSARLGANLTLMATLGESTIGFASLKDNAIIDMLYVHPEATGQGAATALLDALEKLAAARGATSLSVDASDSAHDFFKARGYVAQQRNTILLGNEWLGNTNMKKELPAAKAVGNA